MLHEDRVLFNHVLDMKAEETGMRKDLLEKDYYVDLMLYELSSRQAETPAYFKGGTALYKMLETPRRFSEDIDLTIPLDDSMSNNQKKRRLEKVTLGLKSLPIDKDDPDYDNRKGSITSVYKYEPLAMLSADPLQRFGRVKIEGTSFGISEPIEQVNIVSRLSDPVLGDDMQIPTFAIPTLKIERIFADKIFAAEAYWESASYRDSAKHVFDLCVLSEHPRIRPLLNNGPDITLYLSYRREEERARHDSDLEGMDLSQAGFLNALDNNEWRDEFEEMQRIYVFDDNNRMSLEEARAGLEFVSKIVKEDNSRELLLRNRESPGRRVAIPGSEPPKPAPASLTADIKAAGTSAEAQARHAGARTEKRGFEHDGTGAR